jgi:hypothetical protein
MQKKCPNCDTVCTTKFCPECGQKQSIHKETFWHLISHFIGHYFHYDSKFWTTIKTLCFSPGKLTLAYHKLQRAKYIPPISLYIFVSVVFFLFFSKAFHVSSTYNPKTRLFEINYEAGKGVTHEEHSKIQEYLTVDGDSLRDLANDLIEGKRSNDSLFHATPFSFSKDFILYTAGSKFITDYMCKNGILTPDVFFEEIAEKFIHIVPKVFFVLMPLLALLLFGIFFSNKDYYFVDHAVMSLHVHTVLFLSLMLAFLLSYVYIPDLLYTLYFSGAILPGIYFLLAAKNFYQRSWVFTIIAGSIVWLVYLFLVMAISIAALFFVTAYF